MEKQQQEEDLFRKHLCELVEFADEFAFKENWSGWFRILGCLYRDSYEALEENKEDIKSGYDYLSAEHRKIKNAITSQNETFQQGQPISIKGLAAFVDDLGEFDMRLKGVLYMKGLLTKKSKTEQKEEISKLDSPRGY